MTAPLVQPEATADRKPVICPSCGADADVCQLKHHFSGRRCCENCDHVDHVDRDRVDRLDHPASNPPGRHQP